MQIATTLEQGSEHPLAKAVMEHASSMGIRPGAGERFYGCYRQRSHCHIDGDGILLGSPGFLREQER